MTYKINRIMKITFLKHLRHLQFILNTNSSDHSIEQKIQTKQILARSKFRSIIDGQTKIFTTELGFLIQLTNIHSGRQSFHQIFLLC